MQPDNYPSLEEEGLTPREQDAIAYWKRYLPKTVAQLEKQGPDALPLAVRKAAWEMEYNILLDLHRSPSLSREQVEEFRRTELYPPPEPAANPDRNL
jgi:hypothetical protein